MCLKEFCFPDYWKVSFVVLVLENDGERSMTKKYCPVSLLPVVSKVFGKLVTNTLHGLQYGFRSSRSTADLLRVYLIELLRLLIALGLLKL